MKIKRLDKDLQPLHSVPEGAVFPWGTEVCLYLRGPEVGGGEIAATSMESGRRKALSRTKLVRRVPGVFVEGYEE